MPSPFIGGRIPQSLHDALQKHIADSGEKLPQILQKALSNYLDYKPTVVDGQAGLEERLATLEAAFQELREAVNAGQQADISTDIKDENSDNAPDIKNDIRKKERGRKKTDNKTDIEADSSDLDLGEFIDNFSDNSADISDAEELTHEQVAERLGKKLGTIRSYHGQERILDHEGYRYTPGGRPRHPIWLVEEITD